MICFQDVIAEDLNAVNRLIIRQGRSSVSLVEEISYHLIDSGGKRLRPVLVLLVANALNYRGEHHFSLATIIEFIHSATLLHDDVVDMSDLRRGKTTANARWGNAPSVLVGDFLYSRAFQLMVTIGNMEIMKLLADTTNAISEGEVQQLLNIGDTALSESEYFTTIHKKTAILFEAACVGAVILAHESEHALPLLKQAMRSFGYHLGMAFQLMDDALDYSGNSKSLGKNVGDDLKEGKITLPLILAMQRSQVKDRELIQSIITSSDNIISTESLEKIVFIINETGALVRTRELAEEHIEHAKSELNQLSSSVYKTALLQLAEFAIRRNH